MYKIDLRTNEKIFLITMNGLMTEKDSISYIEEYKRSVKNIDPSQYSIIVDTRELKTSPQNLSGLMEDAMDLIISTPFKMRYSIMPESFIAASQVKRIGRDGASFNNSVFTASYEEALSLMNKRGSALL